MTNYDVITKNCWSISFKHRRSGNPLLVFSSVEQLLAYLLVNPICENDSFLLLCTPFLIYADEEIGQFSIIIKYVVMKSNFYVKKRDLFKNQELTVF